MMYCEMFNKFNQINLNHLNEVLQLKTPNRYLLFRNLYQKFLRKISQNNRLFAKHFTIYFLINVPLGCISLRLLFHTKIFVQSLTILLYLSQILVLVIIHFIASQTNHKIVSICKQMMKQFVIDTTIIKPIDSLKINCFIQAFYTKNRYGFTYWGFGKITMFSFFKVRNNLKESTFFIKSLILFSIILFLLVCTVLL